MFIKGNVIMQFFSFAYALHIVIMYLKIYLLSFLDSIINGI